MENVCSRRHSLAIKSGLVHIKNLLRRIAAFLNNGFEGSRENFGSNDITRGNLTSYLEIIAAFPKIHEPTRSCLKYLCCSFFCCLVIIYTLGLCLYHMHVNRNIFMSLVFNPTAQHLFHSLHNLSSGIQDLRCNDFVALLALLLIFSVLT